MKTLTPAAALILILLVGCATPLAQETPPPPPARAVQVLQVNGAELTGLNAPLIADAVARARQQGAGALVVELGGVTRMTEAGLAALTDAAASLGRENFAVANLAGQPAELVQAQAGDQVQVFPSAEAATEALAAEPGQQTRGEE